MRGGVIAWLTATVLLVGTAGVRADQPRQLDDAELQSEMRINRLLAVYIERNGMPDVAERSFLADMPPWDDHQVTLYYLDRHKAIALISMKFLPGRRAACTVVLAGGSSKEKYSA